MSDGPPLGPAHGHKAAHLVFSLGRNRRCVEARRVEVVDARDLARVLTEHRGVEAWQSPIVWRGDRRSGDAWESSAGVALDIDYHDSDGEHAAIPEDLRDRCLALVQPICSLAHATPRGLRVVLLFHQQETDAERWVVASRGAAALVRDALAAELRAPGSAGVDVDSACVADRARLFFAPTATVNRIARQYDLVHGAVPAYDIEDLAARDPSTLTVRLSDEDELRRAIEDDARQHDGNSAEFSAAATEWNAKHTPARGWGQPGSSKCPICGHNQCFGSLPQIPERWCCFSSNHGDVGLLLVDGKGRHGDALDLAVHQRGLLPGATSRAKALRDDGYLTGNEREHVATVGAAPNDDLPDIADEVRRWPSPLGRVAMLGLAGDLVTEVAPYTEADPVALLVHLLAAYGVALNKGPHLRIGADMHCANIYVGLVGATSTARKGTAWSVVRAAMREADGDTKPDLAHAHSHERGFMSRVMNGLTSGEGLIHEVRDARWQKMPVKEGGKIALYEDACVDSGVEDKRLLIVEPELSRTFGVMRREGNTLSALLRQAWDGDNLRVMAKTAGEKATMPHIGVVGHITQHELLTLFDDVSASNGFGNRFLWICCRRSKLLPDAPAVPDALLAAFGQRIRKKLQEARKRGEMQLAPCARARWREEYEGLTSERPGLLGSMLARGAPIVLRLALIYACLDGARAIEVVHLEAALELWRYSVESATWIFGDRLGDPIADRILAELRANPEGLTQNEVRDLFARNMSAARISHALTSLVRTGVERVRRDPAGGRGRPAVLFRLRSYAGNAGNGSRHHPDSTNRVSRVTTTAESPAAAGIATDVTAPREEAPGETSDVSARPDDPLAALRAAHDGVAEGGYL